MSEDLVELTAVGITDKSASLKIEFPADYIQKIMVMQKESKDNWQSVAEWKIEDRKETKFIRDMFNLVPATKYKFQAILTTKNGKIIQTEEVKIMTEESSSATKLSNENIQMVKTLEEVRNRFRIGFVGTKSSGKTSLVDLIASIFRAQNTSNTSDSETTRHHEVFSDVQLANTNITLVDYHGSFDQSEADLNNLYNLIHGLISHDASLNDSNTVIPASFELSEFRTLDAIVIVVSTSESEEKIFSHIRKQLLLATKAGIKAIVFVTKSDLLGEPKAVTTMIEAMVERDIPRELIYHTLSSDIENHMEFDVQAKPILRALNFLVEDPNAHRSLRVLIRPKGEEIFKRCWIEAPKSYLSLLELICKTFVSTHPPRTIYELKDGIKIAIENSEDVRQLKEDAHIEFESNNRQ